jgi:hypothetical protein
MATRRSQSSAKQPVKVAGTCSREVEFPAALDRFMADYADGRKHRAVALAGRLGGPVRGTRRNSTAGYGMGWSAIQETMLPTLLCLGAILIGLVA